MSIYWILDKAKQLREFRKRHQKCRRCGSYYPRELDSCSHCVHLSDAQLNSLLAKKRGFRMTLGKTMLLGAALILLLMIILAGRQS